jgi:hypothetical protein
MAKKRRRKIPSKLSIERLEVGMIVLVDEQGVERAMLTCSTGPEIGCATWLHMNDEQGRPRLSLQVNELGSSVCLYSQNDATLSMKASEAHGVGIWVSDRASNSSVSIGVPGPKSGDPRGIHPDITVMEAGRGWSVFTGTYQIPKQQSSNEDSQPASEGSEVASS